MHFSKNLYNQNILFQVLYKYRCFLALMIDAIFLSNRAGEYQIKRQFVKDEIDIGPMLNTKGVLRNFFEFKNRLYIARSYERVKIIFITKEENPFLILSYIDDLLQILNTYFLDFSDTNLIYNFEELFFILDCMFLDGKLIHNNKEKILEAVEFFFKQIDNK